MNRDQLADLINKAAHHGGDDDILIIGSQAILGSYPEYLLPDETVASREVDVAFFDDPGWVKGDRVDAEIGELSDEDTVGGAYAQGVEVTTATLPKGWQDRLIPFEHPAIETARARCLEPHDLVISKLVAGREKDLLFADALIGGGFVRCDILRQRARQTDLTPEARGRLMTTIRGFERKYPDCDLGL